MSNDAFARAIHQIANEAEEEKQRELRHERRRQLIGKVRQVCVFLFGAAAIGCGFYYHHELQNFVSSKFGNNPQVDSQTSAAVKDIRAQADKRDKVLDEITKK